MHHRPVEDLQWELSTPEDGHRLAFQPRALAAQQQLTLLSTYEDIRIFQGIEIESIG